MARKITERERLITFVLQATTEQLTEAKELIDTALRQKAPKKRARTPREPASKNPPAENQA